MAYWWLYVLQLKTVDFNKWDNITIIITILKSAYT